MADLEKRLVRKLDCFILVYCCAAYFFNYLDRSAFSNAYVSGLKEALNLQGNQYSVLLSVFTAGACVGQIPHALIIQKVPPRFWLPFTLLVWSGLTMCSAACKTYAQLCVVRFLQGFFESSLYSGTIYILGSWYTPSEIAKRTAIFTAIGQIGSMFAGVMMTAMNESLHGQSSLAGWQWVFIINGAMGIPFGIFGLMFFPNLPESTNAPYFTKEDIQFALDRLPPKRDWSHDIGLKSLTKRILAKPDVYILTLYSIVGSALEAIVLQGLFLLWLKANVEKFPSYAPTTYPLGIQAVAIVSNIGAGYVIDMTNRRIPIVIVAGVLQLLVAILLLVPTLSTAGTFFAFYLAGTSYMVNPIMYGWASVICRRGGDDASRSVILYIMSMVQSILYTFWGVALYPATDAPYWRKGCITMIVVVFAFFGTTAAMQWLDKRTENLDSEVTEDLTIVGEIAADRKMKNGTESSAMAFAGDAQGPERDQYSHKV
ncbi:ProP Permease of the major facilitator superfamily [Pyrenophora tritici-repentis]|nr:ProP Permease of the major facilitator superfamily [Pyrenophora tritici-repentis]KAI1576210.1 ProP Permease of the major facilitator superfamily [Pyrenophora tritici-repentis]KAI1589524.1 ProP Permease of the major facilitator superfamily [Pyrenophora tritici-repentis]KAI2487242.1 MFS general substrate transporter [Pyrenophora tritici-repentis]